MIKFLLLWIVAYFAYGLSFQDACLSQCRRGCFVDFQSQRCRSCPVGCNECRDSDTCIACSSGYYLNKKKNCVKCGVANCKKCTKQGECTQCKSGYYLKDSSSCVSCEVGCETCASATTCKTCKNGTSLARQSSFLPITAGTCQSCPYGCNSCEIPEVCSICQSGYTMSNFQCISCSKLDWNCVACNESVTRCTECDTGSYLLGNKCLQCGAACAKCLNYSICQKCIEGYFLKADDRCSTCMPFCMSCQNGTTCSQCEPGYAFDSEKGECTNCYLDCGKMIVSTTIIPDSFTSDPLLAKTDLIARGVQTDLNVVANSDEETD